MEERRGRAGDLMRRDVLSDEWVTLPGGELEAPRQGALCAACRAALREAARRGLNVRRAGTLCFECHRAELRRQEAVRAAADCFTGSAERFQTGLPFEPVDRARLSRLRMERAAERARTGPFVDRRRRAQIEARHALAAVAEGLRARRAESRERSRAMAAAIDAAELQLPESWLPFVVGR